VALRTHGVTWGAAIGDMAAPIREAQNRPGAGRVVAGHGHARFEHEPTRCEELGTAQVPLFASSPNRNLHLLKDARAV
jgi:hypothetical protein